VYSITRHGHTYLYQVAYGEELAVARIIVRSDTAGTEGLFLVKQDGSLEPADHDRGSLPAESHRVRLMIEPAWRHYPWTSNTEPIRL
jgi:hypothetical protein